MTGGIITLMGSGELTGSMVEVYKQLLRPYGDAPRVVFLDTPAGFQLNADQIAAKAAEYFQTRVGTGLTLASLKSVDTDDRVALEKSYDAIRCADLILIGPGSPTYALGQWRRSPVPELFVRHVQKGGCIVASSAAALTMGRWTLPVYEIYKVGQPPHWVEGLDVLNRFGLDWAVLPHWNNAEGGNHDTRYCFMGAARMTGLAEMVPPTSDIVGLDEHTALIIDLAQASAQVRGIGQVTVRRGGRERVFGTGEPIPLALLRGREAFGPVTAGGPLPRGAAQDQSVAARDSAWDRVQGLAAEFQSALDRNQGEKAIRALLALERHIWDAQRELAEHNALGAVRERFRDLLAQTGVRMARRSVPRKACLTPLVAQLLALRERWRAEKKWADADAVRDCLLMADIVVEDTAGGARWHLAGKTEED